MRLFIWVVQLCRWLFRRRVLLQLALKEQRRRHTEFGFEFAHYKQVRMMQQRLSRSLGQRAFSEKMKREIKRGLNAVER